VVAEVHQEIADLLGGPRPVWVRGDPEDMDVAAADLDDEEAVQAPEGHAVHVEEVDGEHRGGLCVQELVPGGVVVPLGCRGYLKGLENPSDGGCADPMTELEKLALNALIPPHGVLGGESLDQRGDLGTDRRPARPVRIGPLPGNEAAVPPQHSAGCDQPAPPQAPGQEPDQRGEDRAIRPSPARAWAWYGAARQPRAAAPATRCPWRPASGRAGPASRKAG
jgi:hypothetical protein